MCLEAKFPHLSSLPQKGIVGIKGKKVKVGKWRANVKGDYCYSFSACFCPIMSGAGAGGGEPHFINKTKNKESCVGLNFQIQSLTE